MRRCALPLALVVLAAALRLLAFPTAHSPVASDETGYLSDGLLVLEGITPGYKFVPSGVLTWLVTLVAGGDALRFWLVGDPAVASAAPLLKPVAAIESSLFRHYADLSTLRAIAAATATALGSLASGIAAAAVARRTGVVGALTAGLLAAGLPILVELASEARPYAFAWSLALVALAVAQSAHPRRAVISGVLIGLAVGTRIDMVLLGPVQLLLLWRGGGPPWRDFGVTIGAAALSFMVIAPWYLPHLPGNIRFILSVRLLDPNAENAAPAWLVMLSEGVAVPLVLALAGMAVAAVRRQWTMAAAGVWLLLLAILAFKPSAFGLRHDGALVITTIILAPHAIAALQEGLRPTHRQIAGIALLVLATAPALVLGTRHALSMRERRIADDAVAWIERNVAAGTRVFVTDRDDVPLPTAAAADRLWADLSHTDAWKAKFRFGRERFGIAGSELPRAMSEEHMYQERGIHRRFYVLGASRAPARPRYDLWTVSNGSFFDVPLEKAVQRICDEGGVLLHTGTTIAGLPAPAASWPQGPGGWGTRVYVVSAGSCRPG